MACGPLRIVSAVRPRSISRLRCLSDYVSMGCTRIRQYPLYSKKEPPASLAGHFDANVFDKSQKYGKDKAKFALFSGLYKQIWDSLMLHYGFYAWAWTAGGHLLSKFGYGSEYEVRTPYAMRIGSEIFCGGFTDPPIDSFCLYPVFPFVPPDASFANLQHVRAGGETWIQQDDTHDLRHRYSQGLACRICLWSTVPRCLLADLQMGG